MFLVRPYPSASAMPTVKAMKVTKTMKTIKKPAMKATETMKARKKPARKATKTMKAMKKPAMKAKKAMKTSLAGFKKDMLAEMGQWQARILEAAQAVVKIEVDELKFVSMLPPGCPPPPGCEALEDEPTSGGGGHGPDGGKGPDNGHGGDGGHGRDGRLTFKRVHLPSESLCFFSMVQACRVLSICRSHGFSRPGEGQPF